MFEFMWATTLLASRPMSFARKGEIALFPAVVTLGDP